MSETLPPLPAPDNMPPHLYEYFTKLRSYIATLDARIKTLEDAS